MNYGAIKTVDIANGLGVRVSLFVSGCRNRCPGCFQPETWDFSYGQPFTKETEDKIIKALCPSWIQGLSILGGEPLEYENQAVLIPFLRRVRKELPEKDIWLYTGYYWEQIRDLPIVELIDTVVDGPFIEEMKDVSLAFRGSWNQRIIQVKSKLEHFKSKNEVIRSKQEDIKYKNEVIKDVKVIKDIKCEQKVRGRASDNEN